MGLDQYIFREFADQIDEDGNPVLEQIHYWRKNYELNDWACNHFCPDHIFDFNCENLELEEYMVDELLKYILYNLDKSSKDENGYNGLISNDVYVAFNDCKERLKRGEQLYYHAWW